MLEMSMKNFLSSSTSDMGTKEEVKPNFRTPPRWGHLVADWHARTTYDM
jgi:hypothetical protein